MVGSKRLSRRALTGGAVAALAVRPGLAQTPGALDGASPVAGWSFVDDRGITVTLPAPPARVLAQINAAASLWDFGVRPVGIWGPARTVSGEPHANAGRIDLDAVTSVTEGWDEPDLERFLALDPDLIVSTTWDPSQPDLWGIYPPEVMDQVDAIAPSIAISVADITLAELIGRFEELAAALGADIESADVVAARAEFAAAQARLAAAIAAKPGLRVLFGGAGVDQMWAAAVPEGSDLRLYAELGVNIVDPVPENDEAYPQISWERSGGIVADLIMFDARVDTGYPSLEETIAAQPTFAQHPAVVAGQTAPWNYEFVMSYQGAAQMINDFAAAIESAAVLDI